MKISAKKFSFSYVIHLQPKTLLKRTSPYYSNINYVSDYPACRRLLGRLLKGEHPCIFQQQNNFLLNAHGIKNTDSNKLNLFIRAWTKLQYHRANI